MTPTIFLSYRWDDSGGWTRAIYDRLASAYGPDGVFYDNASMGPGSDIDEAIRDALPACEVVVPVIGRRWLASLQARAEAVEEDRLLWEVQTAIDQGKHIVPALVDGGAMPRESELPEGIRSLQRNVAIEITPAWLDRDIDTLLGVVAELVPPPRQGAARLAGQPGDDAPPTGGPPSAPAQLPPSRLFVLPAAESHAADPGLQGGDGRG